MITLSIKCTSCNNDIDSIPVDPHANIPLAMCMRCGQYFLLAFKADKIDYSPIDDQGLFIAANKDRKLYNVLKSIQKKVVGYFVRKN